MPAYSPTQARDEIEKLVETFARNESALQHAPEAQIENDFLRPLFRYLNWNVDNVGLSRAQWEFVLQRTERGKRPDYELWLDGWRVLLMDAKKVKYEMHDPRWQNQVYAYAYSTQNDAPARKTDFAILTDFQEFIVLDCTLLAGTPEAINNFRILDWRYPDYVARFDELWELFERNNVLEASRGGRGDDGRGVQLNAPTNTTTPTGLWARYLSPKKVKANRMPPDKAFLSALDDVKTGWRVRLAKDMKKHNPALGGDVLTAAVQLWIDRLIFIKVLSDRAIEDDYLAQMADVVERDGLAENNFGWFTATRGIFQKLNQIYNGSIFAPRPELEAVNVSNKIVREIIGELLPENSPYNFDSLPVEILGTIYERFLGRVVHATDKQVRIEDKPEVRKAGGVFYTPQYIVHYIVANTVGKLLEQCKTPADVAQLKILDPACGSGSFLIGAYDALLRWHENYYDGRGGVVPPNTSQGGMTPPQRKRDRDAAYYDDDGRVRLTAKLKRQILVNNLFGVDIDPQAVEVTRLSLSLKALEDTRREELYQEVDLFHQRVLPDLTQNIKCGNSLIGTDFIFTDADELKRVKPFDWRAEFPQVFASQTSDVFGNIGSLSARGFDAVIGNPPYGAYLYESDKPYLSNKFKYQTYQLDTYLLFLEQSVTLLLRNKGMFGMIIPNPWLTNLTQTEIRKFVMEHTRVNEIIHFLFPVFPKVTVDTEIVILQKSNADGANATVSIIESLNDTTQISPDRNGKRIYHAQAKWRAKNGDVINIFTDDKQEHLQNKCEASSVRLETLCKINVGIKPYQVGKGVPPQTRKIVEDRSFDSTVALDKSYRAYLRGSDIARYKIEPLVPRFLKYGKWLAEPRPAADFDARGKIVMRQTGDSIIAALDSAQYLCLNNMHVLVPTQQELSLMYILGVMNSNLITWYYRTLNPEVGEALAEVKKTNVAKLPIRLIDFTNPADVARHDKMVALVERILTLHQQRAAAQTETDQQIFQRQIDATDKQIDALVYELYELTDDEIRTVENSA